MKVVGVVFDGTQKLYNYRTRLNLMIDGRYDIVADNKKSYDNPVTIVCIRDEREVYNAGALRVITSAKLLDGTARPDDGVEKFIFNEEEGVTVVIWKDGTKTIIRCQEGDTFDKEKAIALCYMKKALGNRGSFNETLKKWTK